MSTVTLAANVPGWVGNGERWAVPLTTIWTPPPGCPPVISREPGVTVASGDASLRCYPPHYNEVWVFSGYYSPGLCMSGYTIACWATATVLNLERIKPGETAAICVPRYVSACRDSAFLSQTCTVSQGLMSCGSSCECLSPEPNVTPYAYCGGDYVPAFQIRWKSSDLVLFAASANPTTTLPTGPAPTTLTGGSTVPPVQPSPTQGDRPGPSIGPMPTGGSSSGSSAGLSPSTIAGIVVGVITGLLLAAAAAFLLFRYRKRGRHLLQFSTTELGGNPKSAGLTVTELPASRGRSDCELPAQTERLTPMELSGEPPAGIVSELPGRVVTPIAELWSEAVLPADQRLDDTFERDSSPVAVAPLGLTEDMERELNERQARLQERRRRLLELEQIDQEEESIRRRLSQLQQRPSGCHKTS